MAGGGADLGWDANPKAPCLLREAAGRPASQAADPETSARNVDAAWTCGRPAFLDQSGLGSASGQGLASSPPGCRTARPNRNGPPDVQRSASTRRSMSRWVSCCHYGWGNGSPQGGCRLAVATALACRPRPTARKQDTGHGTGSGNSRGCLARQPRARTGDRHATESAQ